MKIQTLMDQSHYTLPPSSGRHFGGTKTTEKRRRGIAYAWRRHRDGWDKRADRNPSGMPFWFRVTGSVFRSTKTGKPVVSGGRVIGFVTAADRTRAIPFLRKLGYNSFTEFRDVNATFALQIGKATFPKPEELGHNPSTGVVFSNRVRS
jgi:hypothetical protein